MRNVKNTIVMKIATLALGVAGLGLASPTFAQDAQCDGGRIDSACNQPVIDVRNAGSRPHENANALRERMESVSTRIGANLEASPQWVYADAEWQKATADVAAGEERVRQAVSALPDYQAAAARKQAAQDLAANLRRSGAGVEQIVAAAQSALDAGKTLTQIEREAAAGDPELIEARAKLQEMVAVRQGMQASVRDQVLNDPQWQHASRQLERLQ